MQQGAIERVDRIWRADRRAARNRRIVTVVATAAVGGVYLWMVYAAFVGWTQ